MSVAYAYVSYQTAYLKAHYPVEFMAALMTSQMGNSDKIAQYIEESERMGIEILPPDLNYSRFGFTVDGEKIRFGLEAIKNVGHQAIEAIINGREEKKYTSLKDFCQRVNLTTVNQRVIESLIKAGACDSFEGYRSQMLEILPKLYSHSQSYQRQTSNGQTSFFDLFDEDKEFVEEEIDMPIIEEFNSQKLLALEKEMLGFYLSGHPLDEYLEEIKRKRTVNSSSLKSNEEDIIIGGLISSNREILTKNNKEMSFLTLEDELGRVEVVVFPNVYHKDKEIIASQGIILISGQCQEGKVIAEKIGGLNSDFLQSSDDEQNKEIHIKIDDTNKMKLKELRELFSRYKGNKEVYLHLIADKYQVVIKTGDVYGLKWSDQLKEELNKLNFTFTYL